MAKRIPLSERPDLIRKPDDWARDWGWVSRRRAVNLADRLYSLAAKMDDAMGDDEGVSAWSAELRTVAKRLAPDEVPARKKLQKARKVAAMREP